ncbi:MAG: ArsR family transcriptional regulator [Dehalococcoidia bacterium]
MPGVPPILALASDPLRWTLLTELSRSDRSVEELVAAAARPQNLVSYHLGLLNRGGIVEKRRSSGDGRIVYYMLDGSRIAEMLDEVASALHPAFADEAVQQSPSLSVLFLCTENSARSQMAEALWRRRFGPTVDVWSAGTRPTTVHPGAIAEMESRGISMSGAHSKSVSSIPVSSFDVVVTVCDRVREDLPAELGARAAEHRHWSLPDPAQPGLVEAEAFRRAADELERRVAHLTF